MDEPSAQSKVHFAETDRRVIKDIENLEKFYDAKVLAIKSRDNSETTAVHFGSQPIKHKGKKPKDTMYGGSIYPSDTDYETDGSYIYYERLDTPAPDTPKQAALKAATMWGNPPKVQRNDDYPSSVLSKDVYL